MSAPFVAGAAALAFQRRPNATPGDIRQALVRNATKKILRKVPKNTPNLLLFAKPEKYRGFGQAKTRRTGTSSSQHPVAFQAARPQLEEIS